MSTAGTLGRYWFYQGPRRPPGQGDCGGGGQWHHLSTQDSALSGDTKSYQILPVSHYHITSLELEEVFRSFAVPPAFLGEEPQGHNSKNLTVCIQRTDERAGFRSQLLSFP